VSAIATISLRPAALEDAELIFCWRNDPLIVRLGSLQREVSRAEHEKWFAESISSQAREIFIVERDDTAIGQVRFDLVTKAECVISVYLATEFTGNGWGIDAIKQACQLIFELWPVQTVLACVRGENHAGQSAFSKAGFKQVDRRCGSDHESFQLDRLRI
jgi:UDP-2,4-diacetamido-2,4,6-trideoxy-beta-L-altropyranose hydrolase